MKPPCFGLVVWDKSNLVSDAYVSSMLMWIDTRRVDKVRHIIQERRDG
ncbi:hypothetical protein FB440_10756 [Vibrio crassostreae]|nr:hypothetical protein FB440_10756 [Vibrio crassostreae]